MKASNGFKFALSTILIIILFGFISFLLGSFSASIMCDCFASLYGFYISTILGLTFIVFLSIIKYLELFKGGVKHELLKIFNSLFFSILIFFVLFVAIIFLGEFIGGPYGTVNF